MKIKSVSNAIGDSAIMSRDACIESRFYERAKQKKRWGVNFTVNFCLFLCENRLYQASNQINYSYYCTGQWKRRLCSPIISLNLYLHFSAVGFFRFQSQENAASESNHEDCKEFNENPNVLFQQKHKHSGIITNARNGKLKSLAPKPRISL